MVPNTAVEDGDEDANYFQHVPYLDDFNTTRGTHLVSVTGVHIEPMGIYAGKSASLEDLPDGATVAVPNDATNEGRALLLLEKQGLIKLADDSNLSSTPNDIVENPKNLTFTEVEAATVPSIVSEVVSSYPVPVERLTQDEKMEIMAALNRKGVFLLKGSVSYVAKELHSSEASIYRYLGKLNNRT